MVSRRVDHPEKGGDGSSAPMEKPEPPTRPDARGRQFTPQRGKPTAKQHLDRAYAERVGIQHPDVPLGESAFAKLMEDAAGIRAELLDERARLVDKIVGRCYMSRIRRDIIDETLRRLDRQGG